MSRSTYKGVCIASKESISGSYPENLGTAMDFIGRRLKSCLPNHSHPHYLSHGPQSQHYSHDENTPSHNCTFPCHRKLPKRSIISGCSAAGTE